MASAENLPTVSPHDDYILSKMLVPRRHSVYPGLSKVNEAFGSICRQILMRLRGTRERRVGCSA